MSDPAEAAFWVYIQNGMTKVHRAECPHARDTRWRHKPRVKLNDKNWSGFSTYELADDFAERVRRKEFHDLPTDCSFCKPGKGP